MGKKNPQGTAILWLKDLVDDEEQEVEIPLLVAKDLRQLRQNVVSELEGDLSSKSKLHEAISKTHDFEIIGFIKTRVKLDRGLDDVRIDLRVLED